MFILYDFVIFNSYMKENDWTYKIIDTDFIDQDSLSFAVNSTLDTNLTELEIGMAVIKTNQKAKLNVLANLDVSFGWCHKEHKITIKKIVDCNKKYNIHFHKKQRDIEQNLSLKI